MKHKFSKCHGCKKRFRTVHLWKSNHPLAAPAKFFCEACWMEKTGINVKMLLRYYGFAKKKGSTEYLGKIYDNSTDYEKYKFIEAIGEESNVAM